MNNRVVVLIAMLAVMMVAVAPAQADDPPVGDVQTGIGATPPQPDSAVVVTPPPAPQGAKGEKGERGEAGPQGPAGHSGVRGRSGSARPETDPEFNRWLRNSENPRAMQWRLFTQFKAEMTAKKAAQKAQSTALSVPATPVAPAAPGMASAQAAVCLLGLVLIVAIFLYFWS